MKNNKNQDTSRRTEKKKSKLSKLFEESKTRNSFNEKYAMEDNDYYCGLRYENIEDDQEKRMNNTVNQKLQEIFVSLNILVTIEEIEKVYSVNFLVNDLTSMSEIIDMGIKRFNEEKFRLENKKGSIIGILRIKEDDGTYKLKMSKKNGKPKKDYPPYLNSSTVSDAQCTSFSLLYPIQSLSIKPINNKDRNNSSCKDHCFVF